MKWPGEYKPKLGGLQVPEDDCSYVWQIPSDAQCAWVQEKPDCQIESFISYPSLLFCPYISDEFNVKLALLLLWMCYLSLIPEAIANNFLCPSLSAIASSLGLSDSLTGVAILTLGNGAPDVFAALVSSEEQRLIVLTGNIAAGVFVTALVAGSVALFVPLRVDGPVFLRDALFYSLAVGYLVFIVIDEVVELREAAGCILMYIAFVTTYVLLQSMDWRGAVRPKRMPYLQDPEAQRAFMDDRTLAALLQLPERSRPFNETAKLDVAIARELEHEQVNLEELGNGWTSSRPTGLFAEFFYDLIPIAGEEWATAMWLQRFYWLLRAPITFGLHLLVPVVNETAVKRGWSKLLNCLQICITPLAALFLIGFWNERLDVDIDYWNIGQVSLPLPVVCFGCTFPIALLTFLLTSVDCTPKFHNALAFFGFLSSALLVYATVQEVMAVLESTGFASGVSDSMLGIVLLVWDISIGDLVSNVRIARRGFAHAGFSACFAGPTFNVLMGLGSSYVIAAARAPDKAIQVRVGSMAPGCVVFLGSSLLASTLYLKTTGFVARRSYGFLLYTVYAVFLLTSVLSELKYIHPLGTDHRPDGQL